MRLFFVVSCGLAVSAAAASAPAGEPISPAAGSVSGVVRTSDGRSVPGVAVILEGPERVRVGTDADGIYAAHRLAPGSYSVRVDAPGLAQRDVPAVVVGTAGVVSQDLVLQPAPVRERVVVSATRGEATLSSLGVAADVVEAERIASREAPTLLTLLSQLPGIATARAGQTGQQASLFVRGGESHFARVMVDGVPVNEPGGGFDFGAVLPFELERVELVRGAASSLYGTDALAGVVSLETRRALPGARPSLRAEGEGGSFGWQRFQGATAGARGGFDWNAGAQRLQTDNEAPNSAFEATSVAASAGLRFDERTDARFVARLADSTAGTPGQTAFGPADLDSSFEREDLLLSGVLRRAQGRLSHQLRLGYALSDQLSLDPLDSGCHVPEWEGATATFSCDFPNPEGFQSRTDRLSAGYQADVSLGARHFVTLGTELEHETGELGNRSEELLSPSRTNLGLYVQDRVLAGSRAYLTLGARLEHNESYGTRLVPRAALAVRLFGGEDAATLRGSAGMGIKEPSFLESYGQQLFARGNADLEPERSTTWDVGIEQRLFGSRLRATATFFHHDYEDQIAYTVVAFDPFEGTYVNLAQTRAQGLELAAEARPVPELSLYGQYTFLDGEILESPRDFDPIYAAGEPLLRRPRHQGSLEAELTFPRWSAGATLVLVGERADSDFVGIGLTTNPGYARLDARLRVRLVGALEAFVVADNLLDEAYQEALGYPALGRSVRGGLRLRVGGVRP